jgi:hypothetical protein
MAKLDYQRISREKMLKTKPIVSDKHDSRKHIVDDDKPVSLNGPEYVLKFGKYKGKMLKDIPDEYLHWTIMNVDDSTVNMFVRELQRRDPSFR